MKTFARNSKWLCPTAGAFRFFVPDQWPTTRSVYRNLAALIHGNGVKILAGTDQSSYLESKGSFRGQSLHEELAFFVEAGFTPAEALRAATTGPAEFFGRADSEGAIKAGTSADLVPLDANPLQEISNTRCIAAVIKQGHLRMRARIGGYVDPTRPFRRQRGSGGRPMSATRANRPNGAFGSPTQKAPAGHRSIERFQTRS